MPVVSGLVVAARYLTIVPLPGPGPVDRQDVGRAAAWFPVVGLLLGLGVSGVGWVTDRLFPGLLAALITVTVWKVVTGGLHLDGLADCLDGLGGQDREERLRIMRDSRIGALGTIGLILFLLLEIAALAGIEPGARWRVLLLAPVAGRALAPGLARFFPLARPVGHAARFRAGLPRSAAGLAAAQAVVVAGSVLGVRGVVALLVGTVAALAVARFFAGKLGGLTGDVHGAAVEVTELAILLVMAAWAPGAR